MPVKTGRKLGRTRVDARVAQAAVRLAHGGAEHGRTRGRSRAASPHPSTPSQIVLRVPPTPGTPAATPDVRLALRPPPGDDAHKYEVADLLERLARDATPRRKEEAERTLETITKQPRRAQRPPLPQGHPDVIAWRKRRSARTRMLQRQAKLSRSYRKELLDAATGYDGAWDCCNCQDHQGFVLPCWDETDNGVPDLCMNSARCPFHPDNGCTNDNFICHIFGNVGFPYFDRRRKVFMALAMWSTLFAMVVTAVGALSLSTDKNIVRSAHWVYVEATNSTSRTRYFLGLRSIVVVQGDSVRSDHLDTDLIVGTLPGTDRENPMREALLSACADSARASALGALLSCVTLVFALLGTINRMRFSSDANVQKALGLVTDTWGAFCLCFTLFNFWFECYRDLPDAVDDFQIKKRWGPAWYCYLFCALSGIIRAWAHWVTPVPDHGVGCCTFRLPKAIMALLDADGDGKLTWADQKLMFGSLRTIFSQQARRSLPFRHSLSRGSFSAERGYDWSDDWQERERREKLTKVLEKQREDVSEAVLRRGDHDPEVDPELGIVAARCASVPTFLVGLSADARYDPRVLDAEKKRRRTDANWSLALMSHGEVSAERARWTKVRANLRRVAADAHDGEEAKRPPGADGGTSL